MTKMATKTATDTKAEAFVRSVLEETFHQKLSDKKLRSIAAKVERVVAEDDDQPQRKRA